MFRPCRGALLAAGLFASAALAQSTGPTNPSDSIRGPLDDGDEHREQIIEKSTGGDAPSNPLIQPGASDRRALDDGNPGMKGSAPTPVAPPGAGRGPASALPGAPMPGR
jgi:hypothetical protein